MVHDINRISNETLKHYWNRTRHQRDINIFYLVTKQLLPRSKIPYEVFSQGNCPWLLSMVELQQSIARLRDHEDKSCRTFFEKYMNQDMCRDRKVNKFLHTYPFITQNGDITNWRSGWYLYATRYLFPETRRMLILTLKKILVRNFSNFLYLLPLQ